MTEGDVNFWNTGKKIVKEYFPSLTDLIVILVMVILALRITLSTPGYLGYADVGWPLSARLYGNIAYVPSLFIGGSLVSLFSLTRDFISWPPLLISLFTNNMQIIERAYYFYGLYLFGIGCYIFAKFFVKTITLRTERPLRRVNKEIIVHSAALFAFSNLVAINYIVDGGFFSDDLILLFISIEILAIWAFYSDVRYSVLTGVLLSLTIFLDPDYYIISIITIFLVLFISMGRRSIFRAIKRFLYAIIISLPSLMLVQFALSDLASPESSIAFYRSLSSVYFNGSNHIWWLSVALLGHAWSIITFGPPSIMLLGNHISTTPGILFPTQILLPGGIITDLWLFAIFSIPFVAFASLIFKPTRRFSIPTLFLVIVGIILSVYGTVPALFNMVSIVTTTPYIGESIATSFSLPGHFLIIVASGYLILFPMTLYNLLLQHEGRDRIKYSRIKYTINFLNYRSTIWKIPTKISTPKIRNNIRKHKFLAITVIVIVILMIFADWQAFDGSFYPARADNSYHINNGVPNAGSFSPYGVPNSYMKGYDYILNQTGSFNVYWPIGLSNPPTMHPISLPGFPYLGSHFLTHSVSPYLLSHDVRFVVVYDMNNFTQPLFSPANNIHDLFYMYFGHYTFTGTLNFLNRSAGLNIAFRDSTLYIYKVKAVSSLFYQSSVLLRNSSSQDFPYVYSLFQNLGINVSTTNQNSYGNSFGINTDSNAINVVSPSFLDRNVNITGIPKNVTNQKLNGLGNYYANSSIDTHNMIFNQTAGANENDGGFWTTDWGGSFTTNVSDGSFSLSSKKISDASIEYGGPPVEGSTNGVFTGNLPVSSHISFNVSNNTAKGSNLYLVAAGLNASHKTIMYTEFPIVTSGNPMHESIGVRLLPGTTYFTFMIEGVFSGSFSISNINMTFRVYPSLSNLVPSLTFGNSLNINNSSSTDIGLSNFSGIAYASVYGTGSLNNIPVSRTSMNFTTVSLRVSHLISIKGNISIAYMILVRNSTLSSMGGKYVTYNVAASKSYILTTSNGSFHPIATGGGFNLFINVTGSNYSISAPSLVYIQYAYYAILLYLAIIMCASLWRKRD